MKKKKERGRKVVSLLFLVHQGDQNQARARCVVTEVSGSSKVLVAKKLDKKKTRSRVLSPSEWRAIMIREKKRPKHFLSSSRLRLSCVDARIRDASLEHVR